MERRRILLATGGLAAIGLAGCLGGSPGAPGGDGGDGGDGSPPDGGDGSPVTPHATFQVTGSGCGTQKNEADVSFGDDQVTVEGTTWGNDACYTARLESATVEGDTLTVRVVAERPEGEDQGCAQCITEIDYRATVETPETPAEVVVVHRGETVTTAGP